MLAFAAAAGLLLAVDGSSSAADDRPASAVAIACLVNTDEKTIRNSCPYPVTIAYCVDVPGNELTCMKVDGVYAMHQLVAPAKKSMPWPSKLIELLGRSEKPAAYFACRFSEEDPRTPVVVDIDPVYGFCD